ncbi:MAG: hypothetical protein WC319_03105, partial [Candidatus Paceibacterota bacterium]
MKKIPLIIFLLFIVPLFVMGETGSIGNPIGSNTFAELVAAVVDWIIGIAMVLAPLVIVYGGFTCMTAMDDAGKLKTGKQIILYAILGFLLALIAKSL